MIIRFILIVIINKQQGQILLLAVSVTIECCSSTTSAKDQTFSGVFNYSSAGLRHHRITQASSTTYNVLVTGYGMSSVGYFLSALRHPFPPPAPILAVPGGNGVDRETVLRSYTD